jgi:hypothetical protein
MPHQSHSSRFYHPHNSGWGVQIMKLLIMKFSPLPCYLVPLRPNILLNTLFSNILCCIYWTKIHRWSKWLNYWIIWNSDQCGNTVQHSAICIHLGTNDG